MTEDGVKPDVEVSPGQPSPLAWIHRRSRVADIYFLANPLNQPLDVTVTLRATASTAQLFDPLDAAVRDLPDRHVEADGRTTLQLHFEPEQALFVVLRDVAETAGVGRNVSDLKPVATVEGPWQVTFDARWVKPLPPSSARDANELTLTFNRLEDWSRHSEEGIKGYSGVATYRTAVDLAAPAVDRQMFVDIGVVKDMARVAVNGRDLGVAWCPPWRVRIPAGLLREQGNEVQITVASTWHNRLAADNALPEQQRLTRVGHGLQQAAARQGLQPAGLFGPVRLMMAE